LSPSTGGCPGGGGPLRLDFASVRLQRGEVPPLSHRVALLAVVSRCRYGIRVAGRPGALQPAACTLRRDPRPLPRAVACRGCGDARELLATPGAGPLVRRPL